MTALRAKLSRTRSAPPACARKPLHPTEEGKRSIVRLGLDRSGLDCADYEAFDALVSRGRGDRAQFPICDVAPAGHETQALVVTMSLQSLSGAQTLTRA